MKRTLKKMDEDAVVGIVVTVLLIGLAVSVTVMVNNVYVPQWTEEQEAQHMDQVVNQFAQFKQNVDLQAMIDQQTSLSSWFTLGSKEIPILNSGRTFGRLSLTQNTFNITINSSVADPEQYFLSTGSLTFEAGNSYYVPQTYTYENGALILKQYDANMLIGKPTFFVTTYGQNLSFTVIDINSTIGKRTASGYGVTSLQTNVKQIENRELPLVTDLTIHTNYPNSWAIALNSTLRQVDSGFTSNEYTIIEKPNSVVLMFHDVNNDPAYPTINIKEVKVFSQISPGWIE